MTQYRDRGYYYEAVPETKALELPIVTTWQANTVAWPLISWSRLVSEAYRVNPVVGACIRALVLAFAEAPMVVKDKNGDLLPRHPLQSLLTRPNELMGHSELASYIMAYMAVGGNCYLHKIRNPSGQVKELWPYHDGQMAPVPGEREWIAYYEFDVGDSRKVRIEKEDIIHLKWPLPDLDRPWMGMSPLVQCARMVDALGEIDRYLYALLVNDATPRTVITFPIDRGLTDTEKQKLEQTFNTRHGADRRGSVAFATGGATVSRLGLGLDELDMTALRNAPEASICSVFGVPAVVAMLYVGLQHMTYSNAAEGRKMFTQDTVVPAWRGVSGEFERDLATQREFGDGLTVEHDTSQVQALQPDMTQLRADAVVLYEKGLATRNEGRALIFMPPEGDIKVLDGGDVFKDGSIPSAEKPTEPEPQPAPSFIDVTPTPPQLTDEQPEVDDATAQKMLRGYFDRKARDRDERIARVTTAMERDVGVYLERQREQV